MIRMGLPSKQQNPLIKIIILFLLAASCSTPKEENTSAQNVIFEPAEGTIRRFENFPSQFVESRNVDIWLPPGYDPSIRYPVLYMHDGQVLFEKGRSYSGAEWEVDEWMTRLIDNKLVRESILVGIWNTPKRFREYQPGKPFQHLSDTQFEIRQRLDQEYLGGPLGDEYLRFIVYELKPFVDSTFSTLSQRENTFIMGSSMGGLISIYAIAEYPEVFGRAACLSTHWLISLKEDLPEVSSLIIDYLKPRLDHEQHISVYFDYGTETLDALYEPHQLKMDRVMEELNYTRGNNWVTIKFEGADHSEISWRERLDTPLMFLLSEKKVIIK